MVMREIPPHNVHYDPALLDTPTRELLHASQTDQTPDPAKAYPIAAAAYDKATAEFSEDANADPTAAAEAAAKAGLRAEQLGKDLDDVKNWFDRSYQALDNAGFDLFQHGTRIVRE